MRWQGLVFLLICGAAGAEEIGPAALGHLSVRDVVILGEVHDNPQTHVNQAQAVAALQPRALVFEMLSPEQAARFDPALRADPVALARALDWQAGGWPDFAMYHPIFVAGQRAAVYGGALPRDTVRQAVFGGAAAAFGAGAAEYGLDRPLPPAEQAAREADQAEAHCGAMPEAMLGGMVEAQRLRDAGLARAVVQALAEVGGPVVLIAGTGHARRDWGVPSVLAVSAPGVSVLAVGQMEGDPGADAPFDLWILVEPFPREDPCAVFRKG